ncbi:response regulator [Spirosoma linguale]|uniref:Response regulator receiver protein n=1 Tax=Spirosoma linguale (strain ATCC 33905 / DSM 74 / LMG 10896 / Claus 1) TaxID=504472 RepID=D2QK58_SPILD|nr:response regulator receiver protein [Spirosoma linguale DSM 74]
MEDSRGPIIFIDDDQDDQLLFKPLLERLAPNNQVVFFTNGQQAIDYFRTSKEPPFIIISEVSMQVMNGLELRRQIEADADLKRRAVPFIFFTHPAYKHLVEKAYELTIQGFFEKQSSHSEMKEQLEAIINYWKSSLHPNRFMD